MTMTNENNSSLLPLTNNDESVVQPKTPTAAITVESIEIHPVRSMTCYICLENIATMHKQFGLQNNCDHFFCFDCLSTWRRMGNEIDKDTGGRCPLCRTRSTFVAPSWRCFNNTNDKRSLIDAHKLSLKRIPCRTLSRYGHCRFGHRCYYNHNIPLSSSSLTFHRWFSSPLDISLTAREHHSNSLTVFQSNTVQSINENNNDEQQEPPRRITYNAHRYRPY